MQLPVFAICGLEGREKEDVGYGVPCPELWGNLMLGWEREEGRTLGPAEGPNSSHPWDLWNLTHLEAEGAGAGRCKLCAWVHIRRACRQMWKSRTQERSWGQGGQFQRRGGEAGLELPGTVCGWWSLHELGG